MQSKHVQKWVITASLVVAVIGFGLFLIFHFQQKPIPLWDDVLLSYGAVFVLFLFFDLVSKGAAQARSETDASGARPVPVLPVDPSRRPVPGPGTYPGEATVGLQRIGAGEQGQFAAMLDEAIPEVLALHELQAPKDASGRAGVAPARDWLSDDTVFSFFITYHNKPIGCVVLCVERKTPILEFLYIESSYRRRHLATYGLRQTLEFSRLLGANPNFYAVLSRLNGRGQRFLQANGFLCHHSDPDNGELDNPLQRFPYQPLPLQQEIWVKPSPAEG